MKNFQQNLKKLEAADTQVLGVSMDSPFANKAFADQIGVTFPLLSDWGGDITRKYGIYVDKYKAARRVNFLDRKGRKNPRGADRQRRHRSQENRGRLRTQAAEPLARK